MRSVTGMFMVAAVYALFLIAGCGTISQNIPTQGNLAVQDYFAIINSVKREQPDLAEALKKFPKGADLHNHLSGTVMPENFIALGKAAGDCFGPVPLVPAMYMVTSATAPGSCGSGFKPLTQASAEEQQQLLRSFSMYQFNDKGVTSIQAGHDQFFAAFGRFGAVSGLTVNMGPLLAKLLQQENAESVDHVETMISFQSVAVSRLAGLLRQQYPDAATYTQSVNYPDMYTGICSAQD